MSARHSERLELKKIFSGHCFLVNVVIFFTLMVCPLNASWEEEYSFRVGALPIGFPYEAVGLVDFLLRVLRIISG